MITDAGDSFAACHFHLKVASEGWERTGAAALRARVFCVEQRIFEDHDRDAIDDEALHLVAVSTMAGFADEVVGTVRIHQDAPDAWVGSRLAVDPRYRRSGALGTALIRLAVRTATGLGCTRFTAHVQARNELMFRRLHWHRLASLQLHGLPHVLMEADLDAYPPLDDARGGFHALAGRRPLESAAA